MFHSSRNAARNPTPERRLTPAELARDFRVGIVLHDNKNAMSEGWAFLPGCEPRRVRGLVDLKNDALWISSGDFDDFRRLGGAQFHHVRRTGYLGLRLPEIARDLGIRIDGGFAVEGGQKLVGYVQEAVRLAIEIYKLDDPMRQLQDNTLVGTLGKALPPPPPSKETMAGKFASAYQAWSSRYVPYIDNAILLRLRFSHLPYSQWLLSNPIPENGWSHVYSNEGFDHAAVMSGEFRPTLIEGVLELDKVPAGTAELIAYGAGGPTQTRSKRMWMTDVEYRWISDFARVHVQSYLLSTGLQELPEAYRLPECVTNDPLTQHQVSIGLLSYMHWQALVMPKYSRVLGRSEHDLYGTWLRAYDRAKCFEAAFVLQEKGFNVSGYGNGSVMVSVSRDRLGEVLEAAAGLGMAFPVRDALLQEFGYAPDYSH